MVAMRTERFLSISLALAAIGYPAAGYANGNHLGWCHGVGNLQHSTGCAGLPTIGPHPSVPTPSVNSVAENQNSYLVPPLPPMARPNLVPQAIPQPSLPPQRTPSMTLGTARVPVMSSLGATSQRLTKPLDPLSLIVPMPGRQQAGQFHRTIHPEIGQTGHNVCLVSGYGRRRTSEVGHEVGLTLGFHLTDAIVRELPFDRHLYAGCFIVVERRWHRDHSD